MESDSDNFESADEDFEPGFEDVDYPRYANPGHKIDTSKTQQIKNNSPLNTKTDDHLRSDNELRKVLTVDNKTQDSNAEITKTEVTVDNNKTFVGNDAENNANEQQEDKSEQKKPKPRVIEKHERPQKTREPKTKLGVKLGTKIGENKSEVFWEKFAEAKKNEYTEPPKRVTCCEKTNEQSESEINSAPSSNLYSQKSNFNPEKNFWESEEDYMELPKSSSEQKYEECKEQNSGWGGWGNWGGVSTLISTAQMGVSTLTQGITTVLETGMGVPDPEELARLDREQKETKNDNTTSGNVQKEEEIPTLEQRGAVFGLGNLVSSVTHITKFVETTGTKVLTGGLDTLEMIGKKTVQVLQEGDPGLKKKRALFKIDQNKPILSQILREAKEKAEEENKLLEERHASKKLHYETLFDDYHGLVHLEALEILSKQCDIKLETLLGTLKANQLTEMQETLAQIKELCELPEEDEECSLNCETTNEKIDAALTEMNITLNYNQFLETWKRVEEWLEHCEYMEESKIHEKAIDSLAHLTAVAVEQFHKAGELLLIKERRSTVDEADSLVQLTLTLTGVIGALAGKFSEKLSNKTTGSVSDNVNSLITNIFLEV